MCTLSEDDVQRARKELNEDPRNRLGAAQKLREWMEEQAHIKCPTGKSLMQGNLGNVRQNAPPMTTLEFIPLH